MFNPIGIGALKIELTSKYNEDGWGFIANRVIGSMNGKLLRADIEGRRILDKLTYKILAKGGPKPYTELGDEELTLLSRVGDSM